MRGLPSSHEWDVKPSPDFKAFVVVRPTAKTAVVEAELWPVRGFGCHHLRPSPVRHGHSQPELVDATMWPKEVKADWEFLRDGSVAYNLRHVEVGELGRILLQSAHQGGCNVTYEVIGHTDGRFEEKKAILEPLIDTVMAALNMARR